MLKFNAVAAISIIVLLVFLLLFFIFWMQIERGLVINLRPLRPLRDFKKMIRQSVETGTKVHFSPGNGGLTGQAGTPEVLNGLAVLSSVQQTSARSRGEVVTTTNDALAYLGTVNVAQSEYEQTGRESKFKPENTRLVTQQDNVGYLAGIAAITGDKSTSASIVLGRIGPEYLLVADIASSRSIPQVAGTTSFEAMPSVLAGAGTENSLVGEEVYAVPAYLSKNPAQLASLKAQDMVRGLIIVAIITGTIAATLGFNVGNLFIH